MVARLMMDQTIAETFSRSGWDQKARLTGAPSRGTPASNQRSQGAQSSL